VVGDLEHVRVGHAPAEQDRVDPLLDVAHQQEYPPSNIELEHDRDVVDAGAIVGRSGGNASAIWPQDAERTGVDAEAVARGEMAAWLARLVEQPGEGDVAGTGSGHPRLEEVADAVTAEEADEPGRVVLVGVGEDDHVDAPVPGREARIEQRPQAIRVGPAVDEHPTARGPLDEDRVALPDVEDRDPRPAVGSRRRDAAEREPERRHDDREGDDRPATQGSHRAHHGGHRRDRATSRTAPAARIAPGIAAEGGSSTDAKGTEALACAIATSRPSGSEASPSGTLSKTGGTPASSTAPRGSAKAAPAITNGMRGAATRFAAGDTSERRPKSHRTSGSVAS
jgi:hypothetical protein